MHLKVLNIEDVTASQMCCGCGACAYVAPDDYEMADVLEYGRRPLPKRSAEEKGTDNSNRERFDAMTVCPGIELEHDYDSGDRDLVKELEPGWGPIYGLWEGYAADEAIRFAGSSGGAASALAQYCLEAGGMHGVLHTAAREDVPYLNETVMSHSRDELLGRTGSRYAPASPCDGLQQIEDAPKPCVFIGKPCDVAGARKAANIRPGLAEKLGLTIGFFCAGTPSTQGTLEMLKAMGVTDPQRLVSLRYRGNGWPGKATAVYRDEDGAERTEQLTYAQSWGDILQKHRQWRCYVCADHTGEFADIAVGDPWYRQIQEGEHGQSLILARTRRGRDLLQRAIDEGYLVAEPVKPEILPASQPNLMQTRGSIWGRIKTCRSMGAAAPRFKGMPMFRFWWRELTPWKKVQSVLGTAKRVFRKQLRDRAVMRRYEPPRQWDPAAATRDGPRDADAASPDRLEATHTR